MTVASKLQSAAGTLAIFRHTLTDWQPDGVVTRARARTRGGRRGRCRCRRWFSPTAALRAAAAWVRARRGAARRGVAWSPPRAFCLLFLCGAARGAPRRCRAWRGRREAVGMCLRRRRGLRRAWGAAGQAQALQPPRARGKGKLRRLRLCRAPAPHFASLFSTAWLRALVARWRRGGACRGWEGLRQGVGAAVCSLWMVPRRAGCAPPVPAPRAPCAPAESVGRLEG